MVEILEKDLQIGDRIYQKGTVITPEGYTTIYSLKPPAVYKFMLGNMETWSQDDRSHTKHMIIDHVNDPENKYVSVNDIEEEGPMTELKFLKIREDRLKGALSDLISALENFEEIDAAIENAETVLEEINEVQ